LLTQSLLTPAGTATKAATARNSGGNGLADNSWVEVYDKFVATLP
jgi:hypothetical protein